MIWYMCLLWNDYGNQVSYHNHHLIVTIFLFSGGEHLRDTWQNHKMSAMARWQTHAFLNVKSFHLSHSFFQFCLGYKYSFQRAQQHGSPWIPEGHDSGRKHGVSLKTSRDWIFKKDFIYYLFLKRRRDTLMWKRSIDPLPLICAPTGDWTQVLALTGNQMGDLLTLCGWHPTHWATPVRARDRVVTATLYILFWRLQGFFVRFLWLPSNCASEPAPSPEHR